MKEEESKRKVNEQIVRIKWRKTRNEIKWKRIKKKLNDIVNKWKNERSKKKREGN